MLKANKNQVLHKVPCHLKSEIEMLTKSFINESSFGFKGEIYSVIGIDKRPNQPATFLLDPKVPKSFLIKGESRTKSEPVNPSPFENEINQLINKRISDSVSLGKLSANKARIIMQAAEKITKELMKKSEAKMKTGGSILPFSKSGIEQISNLINKPCYESHANILPTVGDRFLCLLVDDDIEKHWLPCEVLRLDHDNNFAAVLLDEPFEGKNLYWSGDFKSIEPPVMKPTHEETLIHKASLVINDSKRCVDSNMNIDCSVAQKAVIETMIKNGYRKITAEDRSHLLWLYGRLIGHGEKENVDFMLKFLSIIESLK